jgi:hypothetical protein
VIFVLLGVFVGGLYRRGTHCGIPVARQIALHRASPNLRHSFIHFAHELVDRFGTGFGQTSLIALLSLSTLYNVLATAPTVCA